LFFLDPEVGEAGNYCILKATVRASNASSQQSYSIIVLDARDLQDGTPGVKRLRPIPLETDQILAPLASKNPKGAVTPPADHTH